VLIPGLSPARYAGTSSAAATPTGIRSVTWIHFLVGLSRVVLGMVLAGDVRGAADHRGARKRPSAHQRHLFATFSGLLEPIKPPHGAELHHPDRVNRAFAMNHTERVMLACPWLWRLAP